MGLGGVVDLLPAFDEPFEIARVDQNSSHDAAIACARARDADRGMCPWSTRSRKVQWLQSRYAAAVRRSMSHPAKSFASASHTAPRHQSLHHPRAAFTAPQSAAAVASPTERRASADNEVWVSADVVTPGTGIVQRGQFGADGSTPS